MSSRPWMPLYVGDYLADTGHLTTAQHGCYLLLMLHYWKHGSLPDDDAQLAQICRCRREDWMRHYRGAMVGFFQPGWRHTRIEAELSRLGDISQKRATSAMQMHSKRDASAGHKHTQSQSYKSTSLNGAKVKAENEVAWVPEDAAEFAALSQRWFAEKGKKAIARGSVNGSGLGHFFPAEWVRAVH